ncbi:MAG TPA: hypothetical protein VM686_12560, partial [Polyangiaceae bacterium]|nr:hypothetical protein [Polyangiaceae bacterium]
MASYSRRPISAAMTRPGDVAVKLTNELGANQPFIPLAFSHLIANVTGERPYGHSGLVVAPGRLIEVNGGLPADESGASRLVTNICRSQLDKDFK